jgi:hypothetical protein
MTPAERLLAAADLLDKRAGEATEGPWQAGEFCVWTTADVEDGVIVSDGPNGGGGASEENARYIALVHPEVGKALAEWLRREAKKPMILDPAQWKAFEDGTLDEPEREIWSGDPEALALADLLLAGES